MDEYDSPDSLPGGSVSTPSPTRSAWLLSIALAGLLLLTYAGVRHNGFVNYDDNIYCTENANVLRGLTPEGVKYAFTTFDFGNWTPLTWLSLQLDATLFGVQREPFKIFPTPFHLTNVLLHTAVTVLLFWWLWIMTGALGRAACTAAIFGVHPLRVESVAWLAERKDVLSMFWLMVALLAYVWYSRHRTVGRYLAVTAALALGLMSKSMLVTAPILLLFVDYWPLRRNVEGPSQPQMKLAPATHSVVAGDLSAEQLSPFEAALNRWLWLFLEKVPWLLMSFTVGVMTMIAQNQWAAITRFDALPWGPRLLNAINGYAWYLEKTFLPLNLSAHYPFPVNGIDMAQVAASATLLLACGIYVLWQGGAARWLRMGTGWYVVALLPVIGILQVGSQSHADRYSYLPHVGVLTALIWELHRVTSRLKLTATLQTAVALPLVGICCLLTSMQISHWKDTPTLWTQVLAVNEANWFGHAQLGLHYLNAQQLDQAEEEFRRATELNINKANLWADRGLVALRRGKLEEANKYLQQALALQTNHPQAMYNLAMVYKQQEKIPLAIQTLGNYCEMHNGSSSARVELGRLIARLGKYKESIDEFQTAIRLNPRNAGAYMNLGLALSHLERDREALPHLETAISLNPASVDAHVNLADLLVKLGDLPRAREEYRRALQLNSGDEYAKARLQAIEGK